MRLSLTHKVAGWGTREESRVRDLEGGGRFCVMWYFDCMPVFRKIYITGASIVLHGVIVGQVTYFKHLHCPVSRMGVNKDIDENKLDVIRKRH